jgi:hypothetical protein
MLLYWQIQHSHDLETIGQEWNYNFENANLILLIIAILLMPLNWGIEIFKWKILVNYIQKFTFQKAGIGVLIGIAVGIVTPARVGEYAGRLAGIDSNKRPQALMLNFINSISQNLINFVFGAVGGFYFLIYKFDLDTTLMISVFVLIVLISIMAIFFYFNIQKIINVTLKMPFPSIISKWVNKLLTIKDIPNLILRKVLNLSLWRYSVFVLQYVLVLYFFGLEMHVLKVIAGVSLIYLVQTGIPLPPLSALFARGQLAILVWSGFSLSAASILAATFVLWVINLIFPALIGLILIVLNRYESKTYA